MRSFARKTCSVIAASVLMLSAVSSCGKTPGESDTGMTGPEERTVPVSGEQIEEDSVWYDVNTLDLFSEYDDMEFDSLSISYIGVADGLIAAYVFASYDLPPGLDCIRDDLSSYRYETIDLYDMNGGLQNSIDMKDIYATLPGESGNHAYIIRHSFNGDSISLTIDAYDPEADGSTRYLISLDPGTGNIEDSVAVNDGPANLPEKQYKLGDYTLEQIFLWDYDYYYILRIIPDGGEPYEINLSGRLSGEDVFDISNFVYLGENRALGQYMTQDYETGYMVVDLLDGTCGIYDEDLSWLGDNSVSDAVNTDDGRILCIGKSGVTELDFDSKTTRVILDYNDTNVNRALTSTFTFLDQSEETYIFSSYIEVDDFSREVLTVFTQTDSNPYAGRTILRAAAPEGITYAAAEAVVRFNDQNDEGFIVFDDSYSSGNGETIYPHGMYTENANSDNLEMRVSMSNDLAMDLMTGDGPDIIFGTVGYSQLNSSDYLLDLSHLVPEEGYFSNVFSAACMGEHLYQVPLDCGFSGITASGEDVGYDEAGFTFDSYREFVDNVCNGKDPIGLSRDDYLELCYSAMSECFINDGRVDYDNDAFRALAEYVSLLPDNSGNGGGNNYCMMNPGEQYVTVDSLRDYLYTFGGLSSATRLMGIPSYDGRGPVIDITDSVGISANAADIGICEEFVEYLLSYEGQMIFSDAGYTPVCIEVFEDGAGEVLERYNESVEYLLQFSSREELAACGYFADEVDRSVIDAYEGFIESSSVISMSDPSVTMIIREEMPAYFCGQKTLDEVIAILQNRVQTFLNERG